MDILDNYFDEINIKHIVLKYKNMFEEIERHNQLEDDFKKLLKLHSNNYDIVSLNYKLDSYILEKYIEHFNWNILSLYQDLTVDFMRKYQDKIEWFWISYKQQFDEQFLFDFKDKLDLEVVFSRQDLDIDFQHAYYIK